MGMNGVRQMSDTRRLSPQTTSSSGYHSDLSLTTESPRSIPPIVEQSSYLQNEKTNLSVNKKILRISCFIRKQYERVKLKLTPQKQISQHIITCSKATSPTPVPYKSENHYLQPQELPSCRYKQSSFIEPIYSVYVHPIYDNQVKISNKTFSSIRECYSHQPAQRLVTNSSSYHRLPTKNPTTNYVSNNLNTHRRPSYSLKPTLPQSYYPYKYINKHYDYNHLTYAPLSDFISTRKSAFKPIKSSPRRLCQLSEQLPPSDDPCDLEVAQYFHLTPQWSNPNYFDIYTKDMSLASPRKYDIETLC